MDLFLPSIEETFYTLHPQEYLRRKEQAGGQELIDHIRPEEYSRFAEEYLELGCAVAVIKAGHNGWYVRTGPADRMAGLGRAAPRDPAAWADRELWCPAFVVDKIASAAGSGDCSIAGFLTGLLKGHSLEECLRLANAAGAMNLRALDTPFRPALLGRAAGRRGQPAGARAGLPAGPLALGRRAQDLGKETDMNVLAIGSHPDDVEVFCAGTLLKYRRAGHRVFLALTTSGNIGSNLIEGRQNIARTREAEQLEAARFYDAQVRFLRHDDQGLLDGPELRRGLIEAIRWADPQVIFTNYPGDRSTDHNVTGTVVGRVMLSLPGKNVPAGGTPLQGKPSLFYWDTAAGLDFQPEAYVDISAEMETKLQALACHQSQYAWMDTFQIHNFADHCRIMSELRGLQAGCRYAEGFRAFRIHGFMPDFRLLP